MRHILVIVYPFQVKQDIYVYEHGEQLEKVQCNLEELPETLSKLSIQYNMPNIEIYGAERFNKKVKKKVEEYYKNNYANQKDLNISLS